jgi:hypothetical protein
MRNLLIALALAFGLLSGLASVDAQLAQSKAPEIVNKAMPTPNQEYSQALPANTTRVRITARGGPIKYSWVSGTSGANYVTIAQNASYCQGNVALSQSGQTSTIYMQSTAAGAVAEMEIWH